jgi:hypothetical protein
MRIFRRAYVVTQVVAAESLPEQAGCAGQPLTQSLRKADPDMPIPGISNTRGEHW